MTYLVESVKKTDAFPTYKKATKIKNKYDIVNKSYFQQWIDRNIQEWEKEERISWLPKKPTEELERFMNRVGIRSYTNYVAGTFVFVPAEINNLRAHPKTESEDKMIAKKRSWHNGEVYVSWILEISPENYKWIPPEHIIVSYEKSKNDFDEIVILDAVNERASRYEELEQLINNQDEEIWHVDSNILEDPILVWKLDWHEDVYFLIDYWLNDESILSLARSVLWSNTEMQQVLIQEESRLPLQL